MNRRQPGTVVGTCCLLWIAGAVLLGGGDPVCATTCACMPSISPESTIVLALNPRISLADCEDRKFDSYRPYLVGPGHSVNLELDVENELGVGLGQVFSPAKLLRPRTRYELRFRRLPKNVRFEPMAWTTGDAADSTPPSWAGSPVIDVSRSVAYRVGDPHSWKAALSLPVVERADVAFAAVEVESDEPKVPAGGATHRLFSLAADTAWTGIEIASSSCGLGLELEPGKPYVLAVRLFDQTGNASPRQRVRLSIPTRPAPEFAVYTSIHTWCVLRKVEPEFLDLARKMRLSGTVEGHVTVDAAGAVVAVKVDKALPAGLDRATVDALSQWLFPPSPEPERQLPFQTHFITMPPVFVPTWSAD